MTLFQGNNAVSTYAVYESQKPVEGPRVAKITALIDTDGKGTVSLGAPNIQFSLVQGVFIDNDTVATVTVTHRATGYRVVATARTIGWYEMLATDDLTFDVVSSVPGVSVPLQFINTQTTGAVFPTVASAAQGGTVSTAPAQRNVRNQGVFTTSVTANTSTLILPADANRKKFEIQNRSTGIVRVAVNDAVTTFDSKSASVFAVDIPAGQVYVFEADVNVTGPIWAHSVQGTSLETTYRAS